MTGVTDPRGNTETFVLNQLDQVVRHIAKPPFAYQTDSYYDANDHLIRRDVQNVDENLILQANTHFSVTRTYDALDRMVREVTEVEPGSLVTENVYDANDHVTLERFGEAVNGNQPANVVRSVYDERDLLFRRTRGEGDASASTSDDDYDRNGNVVRVREGLEVTPNVTQTFSDRFIRRIPQVDIDAEGNHGNAGENHGNPFPGQGGVEATLRVTQTFYDGYDRRVLQVDAEGNQKLWHYDEIDNVISERTDGELIDGGSGRRALGFDDLTSIGRLTRIAFLTRAGRRSARPPTTKTAGLLQVFVSGRHGHAATVGDTAA